MYPHPPEDQDGIVDGLAQSLQAVLELGMTCAEDHFDLPTQCPGWTVKDQISHVVSLERWMLGEPDPQVPTPDYEWIRSDFGRTVERGVELRRGRSGQHVVAELAAVLPSRLSQLRSLPDDLEQPVSGPFGPTTLRDLLRMRTIDVWCHEQDLRQALDRPGNLDSAGAATFCQLVLTRLPARAAHAGLPVGTVVILESTGPVLAREGVRIVDGENGSPWAESLFSGVSHEEPVGAVAQQATSIRMSTDALTRRAAGRVPTSELRYTVEGEEDVARRVLDALVVTP